MLNMRAIGKPGCHLSLESEKKAKLIREKELLALNFF